MILATFVQTFDSLLYNHTPYFSLVEDSSGTNEVKELASAVEKSRRAGTNCIKIGLPGKLILSKRKGLWELLFS